MNKSKKITSNIFALCIASMFHLSSLAQISTDNGYSIPVKDTIKVLLVFAELNGGCANSNASGVWPVGSLPLDAGQYFDASISGTPAGYITEYYYEVSLGQYIVLGDYLDHVVTVNCADLIVFGFKNVQNHIADIIVDHQLNGTPLPFVNTTSLQEFDQWQITDLPVSDFLGKSKINNSNNRIDAFIIIWRNNPFIAGSFCNAGYGLTYSTANYANMGTFTGFDKRNSFSVVL